MTHSFNRIHEYDCKHRVGMLEWSNFMPPRKQVDIVEGELYCDRYNHIVIVTDVTDNVISYAENGSERHCMYLSTFIDAFKPVAL